MCVCVSARIDYALAFTVVAGYHERASLSAARSARGAEAVTCDYTYQRRAKAQDAAEEGVGRQEGESGKENV